MPLNAKLKSQAREYTRGTIFFLLPPFSLASCTRHAQTHARTGVLKLIHNSSNAESIHRVRRVQYPPPLCSPMTSESTFALFFLPLELDRDANQRLVSTSGSSMPPYYRHRAGTLMSLIVKRLFSKFLRAPFFNVRLTSLQWQRRYL